MANSDEIRKAIDEIVENLIKMPNEEFRALMREQEDLMNKAILDGTEHVGLALWYATDPSGCQEYIDKIRAEAQIRFDA